MLVKQGFNGRIWTTRLTARLLDIMLVDSAYIQKTVAAFTDVFIANPANYDLKGQEVTFEQLQGYPILMLEHRLVCMSTGL